MSAGRCRCVVNRADATPEQRFFDFVYQPLFDSAGAVEGIAAVVYDVTELVRAREDAEVANRAKDEFLAMLGHELRNPLAPILTALQLLRLRGIDRRREGTQRDRAAGQAPRQPGRRSARRLAHHPRQDSAAADAGRDCRRRGEGDRNRQPAARAAAPHAHGRRFRSAGLTVNADLDRLAQVIANLLTNAAKYTEPGGKIARDRTPRTRRGRRCSVTDNGIGIAADMLPRIFDSFVQDRQALDRARGGLGLGLAIVKSLVSLHDGSVTAESAGRGHGASFTVRLPLEAARAQRHSPKRSAAGPRWWWRAALRNAFWSWTTTRTPPRCWRPACRAYGHDVRTAPDGPTALDVIDGWIPQVAVLDLGLPVMDGYELARRAGRAMRGRPAVDRRHRLRPGTGSQPQRGRRIRRAPRQADRHRSAPRLDRPQLVRRRGASARDGRGRLLSASPRAARVDPIEALRGE